MSYSATWDFEVYAGEVQAADLYSASLVTREANPYGLVGVTELGQPFRVSGSEG